MGRPVGERHPYLCHTLCELGAEPLDEQLGLFRDFLAANPREVVVLFVEPYVPVEEIERALEAPACSGRPPRSGATSRCRRSGSSSAPAPASSS